MLKVEVRPTLNKIDQFLLKLAMLAVDRTPYNAMLAIQFRSLVMRNFDDEGAQHGGWAPLKEGTIKGRQRSGHWPGKILQRSGFLKQSFKEFWDNEVAGVGSDVDYSEFHEKGYSIYGHAVPARKLLPTPDLILDEAFKVYGVYIQRVTEAKP